MVSHANRSPSVVLCQGAHGRGWRERGGKDEVANWGWGRCEGKIKMVMQIKGVSLFQIPISWMFLAHHNVNLWKLWWKSRQGKKRTLQTARASESGGRVGREREISGLCFLSQAMTWLIVFFWSNFGTWKTAHLSWRKMMCRTAQMEISSNEKD